MASVVLNYVDVLKADDMFARYPVWVSNVTLLTTWSVIEITFQSPVEYTRKAYEKQAL